jgi:hypothetical protein
LKKSDQWSPKESWIINEPEIIDLNNDWKNEILVKKVYNWSWVETKFYIIGNKNWVIQDLKIDKSDNEKLISGYKNTWHNLVKFEWWKLKQQIPLYKDTDPNCCPTWPQYYIEYGIDKDLNIYKEREYLK